MGVFHRRADVHIPSKPMKSTDCSGCVFLPNRRNRSLVIGIRNDHYTAGN